MSNLAFANPIEVPPGSRCEHLLDLSTASSRTVRTQDSRNRDQLFHEAKLVEPILRKFLHTIFRELDVEVILAPIKDSQRAGEKADSKKAGDYSQILDFTRGAVVAGSFAEVSRVVAFVRDLAAREKIEIVKEEERFESNVRELGYRDWQFNLALPRPDAPGKTHIVELQVRHRKLHELKEAEGDVLYREIRALQAAQKAFPFGAERAARLFWLKERHKRLFNQVYEEAKAAEGISRFVGK
ncbi:MAG: hypothetical protein AB1540_06275 [Bdellovibrionota bacterium]